MKVWQVCLVLQFGQNSAATSNSNSDKNLPKFPQISPGDQQPAGRAQYQSPTRVGGVVDHPLARKNNNKNIFHDFENSVEPGVVYSPPPTHFDPEKSVKIHDENCERNYQKSDVVDGDDGGTVASPTLLKRCGSALVALWQQREASGIFSITRLAHRPSTMSLVKIWTPSAQTWRSSSRSFKNFYTKFWRFEQLFQRNLHFGY